MTSVAEMCISVVYACNCHVFNSVVQVCNLAVIVTDTDVHSVTSIRNGISYCRSL